MNFSEFIELDVPANAVILRTHKNQIKSVVKIDDKEINELKIRKEAVSFFTISQNYKNPLEPEFTIFIYTSNNIIIENVYEGDEINTLKELEEYVKSIL
ncbi:hypothetical protein, partial [Caminibacter sp.]